jgi:hypothetical protein
MKLKNPRKLYDRECDKCNIEMKTTYPPDYLEKVYCEKCYLEAVKPDINEDKKNINLGF